MKNNTNNLSQTNIVDYLARFKALLLLIVLCAFTTIMTDRFLTASNITNVLRQVAISTVLAVGYTMIIAAGCIDLSVGSVIGFCCIVMGRLMHIDGYPTFAVFLAGMLLGVLCGVVNCLIFIKFKLPPFIVTLGMSQVYKGLTQILSRGTPITNLHPAAVFVGQGYIFKIPVPIILMAVVVIIGAVFLSKSIWGRKLLAVGSNRDAAYVCGINVGKMVLLAYSLVGLAAGIAAIIFNGRAASAQPTAGGGMEMDAIASVVIGGTQMGGGHGNVFGTLIGCVLVGVINNALNLMNVSPYWQMVAKGLLIILAVILDSLTERLRERRAQNTAG